MSLTRRLTECAVPHGLGRRLPRSFYLRSTLEVAPELLGMILVRRRGKHLTAGRIVEVEAYRGADDPASHAFRGMRARNRVMFGEAGHAYVYFIYGMYYCVNVVCEEPGVAGACLIRALEPLIGTEIMARRRRVSRIHDLTSGPGKLCQAMAIDARLNGADYLGDELWISEGRHHSTIGQSPRIGIRHARERPWRFFLQDNRFVSGLRRTSHE